MGVKVWDDRLEACEQARIAVRERTIDGDAMVVRLGRMPRWIVVSRAEWDRFHQACGWELDWVYPASGGSAWE